MKGKETPNISAQWIKTTPIEDSKNEAKTIEQFIKENNLVSVFEFRANLLLQSSALKLSMQIAEGTKTQMEAWNDTQVFFLNDLAKAYGELFVVT
jgi:hypothetical protein